MAQDWASVLAAGASAQKTPTAANSTTLGGIGAQRDQFLKLLLAQLKNQDPLQAPDASKFTDQMTQFGQLEQMFNMNESLGKLQGASGTGDRSQAIGMIGKQISAPGDTFGLEAGKSASLGYTLDAAAEGVALKVYDAEGVLRRTINQGKQSAGTYSVAFDGKSDDGTPLPTGNYRMRAMATDKAGSSADVQSIVQGIVSGVVFDPAGPLIQVGSNKIKLSDVMSVQGV